MYYDLEVYNQSLELVTKIYQLTDEFFPKKEIFGLTSQIRRAAVSIPSNIAEGNIRSSTQEFKRFVNIARASQAELRTLFVIAKNIGYLKEEYFSGINDFSERIGCMLVKLEKSLSN